MSLAHQVFLSHATEDRETAVQLCAALEAEGIGCWMAPRDVKVGTDYAAAILDAIRTSDLVLLIFSASANTSPIVLRDIERAIAYERPVLSLHLDDAVPNASLEYYLNLWQWLDASGGVEDKRENIVAAVREQLAQTSDSATWRRLDARGEVDTKREEISAAVQGHLAQTSGSAPSEEPDAIATTKRRRPSRRTWGIVMGVTIVALALGLGLGLGFAGTGHQGSWTKLDPAGTLPPAAGYPNTAYDPSTRRLIMFAGGDITTHPKNQTWAYDPVANTWAELKPAGTVPPPRDMFSITYDPATRRLILFGGVDRPGAQLPGGGWFFYTTAETWAYDPVANTWTKIEPSGTVPSARIVQSMAYDQVNHRLIMFGGWRNLDGSSPSNPSGTSLNDTWAFDSGANVWTELKPSGTLPSARNLPAMVCDPSTGRMIMFGGGGDTGALNDTWTYDPVANTWAELKPSGTLPSARFGASMVYDPSSHRVIMFGGCNADNSKYFNDTWAYDPGANTWTELKPTGTLPSARAGQVMVYAPPTGQVVMFGGGTPSSAFNDTWAFTP